jgi:hypothetical protein
VHGVVLWLFRVYGVVWPGMEWVVWEVCGVAVCAGVNAVAQLGRNWGWWYQFITSLYSSAALVIPRWGWLIPLYDWSSP